MNGIAPAGHEREHLLPRLEIGDQCVELGEEVLEHEGSFRGVVAALLSWRRLSWPAWRPRLG